MKKIRRDPDRSLLIFCCLQISFIREMQSLQTFLLQ